MEIDRRAVLLQALAVPVAGRAPERPGLPILAYHRFDPAAAGPTTVTLRTLEGQLDLLGERGFRIAPLREALGGLASTAAPKTTAITIDDGHCSVHAVLFPLLKRRRLPVTLFVYPSAISNASYALTWAQLRELRASGLVDVQSHTWWHPNFRTERRRRTPADFAAFARSQLGRSKALIEARAGGAVDMLAWPFGIVDAELETLARDEGYRFGFAYEGGPARAGADPLALPRIPVSEAHRGAAFAALLETRT